MRTETVPDAGTKLPAAFVLYTYTAEETALDTSPGRSQLAHRAHGGSKAPLNTTDGGIELDAAAHLSKSTPPTVVEATCVLISKICEGVGGWLMHKR
jgi:hypothetical protein